MVNLQGQAARSRRARDVMVSGPGFRVQGLRFWVQGLGFRVQGLGFEV